MIKVYTASKLHHAVMWRDLDWPEVEFVARWPTLVGEVPDQECFAKLFWQQDIDDVTRADVVLVYAEKTDKLRGALVEVGVALAQGKHVIVIGEHVDYGTWQYHPQVHRLPDLEWARLWLRCLGGTF